MRPTGSFRVLVAIGLTLAAPAPARACSCMMSGPPCQATWTADVVFAGIVRGIVEIPHETLGVPYRSRLVTMDVEAGFVNAPSGRVDVVTGLGGGDCGYSFENGRRYLVYAWKRGASGLSTGICSRTRLLSDAAEDLRYLKTIAAPAGGARVFGRIHEWRRDPAEETGVDYGPLQGIPVSVRGENFFKEVVTDPNGRFEIAGLPASKALLTIAPPFGFDTRHVDREFEIRDARACVEMDFTLSLIATAWGRVVDATGRPLADVSVDAVAAELAGFTPRPHQRPARTDASGMFHFDDLPPGTYVFGVHLTAYSPDRRSGTPVFLPGTRLAREATVVELKAGDRKDVGVLRVERE